MIMNKFAKLTILLLIVSSSLFGQIKPAEKTNVLAGKFGWGMQDVPETWDNMKTEKISGFIPDQDILAVRICSTDPLFVALDTSFISVISRIEELENQGIIERDSKTGEPKTWQYYVPENRIVLLRQNKQCRIVKNKPADTEFWIVRPQNELPEFVETRNASGMSKFDIILGDAFFKNENYKSNVENNNSFKKPLTPTVYKTALAEAADFMKQKRTALLIIKGSFYGRSPSKILSGHIAEAQNFLKKNGIGDHRVFVRNISNDISATEDADKYPAISIVYEN